MYSTEGRTCIKVTLNGNLVYVSNVWLGHMVGQDAILELDFMVPAGIRLDLVDGTLCLPNEFRIQLSGRRTVYGNRVAEVKLGQYARILAHGCLEVPLKRSISDLWRIWVTSRE